MRVLIGCESSGTVREAFRALGHDAWSCDLLPADDGSPFHITGDLREVVRMGAPHVFRSWELAIFHPPCTFLSSSGLHWNKRRPERAAKTEAALAFVRRLMLADIPRIAIENPVGCISTQVRKPDQIIQPHHFGDDASKGTCLWLKGLPLLTPTKPYPPRLVEWPPGSGKIRKRWGNQTDSGQNKLPPSEDRWKLRSKTYAGIAQAMAEQWGSPTETEGSK